MIDSQRKQHFENPYILTQSFKLEDLKLSRLETMYMA